MVKSTQESYLKKRQDLFDRLEKQEINEEEFQSSYDTISQGMQGEEMADEDFDLPLKKYLTKEEAISFMQSKEFQGTPDKSVQHVEIDGFSDPEIEDNVTLGRPTKF